MLAGLARWIGFLTMTTGAVGVLLLCGGFFWFAFQIPNEEVSFDRKADGIVVLTGAASELGWRTVPVDGALRRSVDWFRGNGYV